MTQHREQLPFSSFLEDTELLHPERVRTIQESGHLTPQAAMIGNEKVFSFSREILSMDLGTPTSASEARLRTVVALDRIGTVMLYFAYGSNTNIEHLRAFLGAYGVDGCEVSRPRMAILHDYRLRTNYYSTLHGAGACTIERHRGSRVEGIVLQVSDAVLACLRAKEGHPRCYQETEVNVESPPARQMLTALTYIVVPQLRQRSNVPVTNSYRTLILNAARIHHFSQHYQRLLQRVLRSNTYDATANNRGISKTALAF